VENVADLLSGERGAWFARVLGDLASLGYNAEWHCIPAASVGAPHLRDRVWVVSYPDEIGRGSGCCPECGDDHFVQPERKPQESKQQRRGRLCRAGAVGATVSDANCRRLHCGCSDAGDGGSISAEGLERLIHRGGGCESSLAHPDGKSLVGTAIARQERNPWPAEPPVGRVVDGVPRAVVQPQLRGLGNAVVPQIPELIGRAILAAMEQREAA
jgi:DNA (cytosine-5)-methyltransferase 1